MNVAVGSVQTIVVCVPAEVTQAPCQSGFGISTAQGYIIDATQGRTVEAQNAPFDYSYAAAIWAMGFTFVVGLYLISKTAGVIVNFIRR